MQTHVLIIGGGCGGLETALELRKQVPDALITLVNPTDSLVYRPWLIYLPAQHRRFEHLQVSLQQAAATYRLRLVTDTVRLLDPDRTRRNWPCPNRSPTARSWWQPVLLPIRSASLALPHTPSFPVMSPKPLISGTAFWH